MQKHFFIFLFEESLIKVSERRKRKMALVFKGLPKCQYMAVAGAGAGAEIMVKVGAGAENK